MKVIVCGDSWMTADVRVPGAHFSEILENKFGHSVTNLSRAGISNVGICFQLQTAIDLKPDVIVLRTTDDNRHAFVVGEFNSMNGLKNFRYNDLASASCGSLYVGDDKAPVIDDVLITIAENSDWTIHNKKFKYIIPSDKKEAIRQYITHLHNYNFHETLNSWMIGFWKQNIKQANIKLIDFDAEFLTLLSSIPGTDYTEPTRNIPWVFHTECDVQTMLAEKIDTLIKLGNYNDN